jgi:DNA-binding response OmpR family regulator
MLIVHIEDETLLRDILKRGFKHAEVPIELHQFETGDEAMPFVQDHLPTIDLFILDIRLPGTMNGIQIAQKLRDIGCPGSIVLTSAYYSSPDPNWLTALSIEYLPKPWYIFEISRKLRQYCLNSPTGIQPDDLQVEDLPAEVLSKQPAVTAPNGKNGARPTEPPGGIGFSGRAGAQTQQHEREDLLDSWIDETRPRRPRDFTIR